MEVQRPVHRTIVIVDVEGFGDVRRTNRHQVGIRKGLYNSVERAFQQAGIPWKTTVHEDRGDGIIVLIPPDIPKSIFVELLPSAFVAALRTHNRTHPGQERIRLRMALHAGEVNYDEHGVTAASINLAFRLLEAKPLKDALAGSPGVLAIIVSSWFFEEVVRHTSAAAAGVYRPVAVTVKETTTTGWVCLPDFIYPANEVILDNFSGTISKSGQEPVLAEPPMPVHPLPPVPVPLAGLPPEEGFVGRLDELSVVAAMLAPTNPQMEPVLVSTIAGLAGVGKTALAVRAARQAVAAGWFSGGVLFMDLHGYDPVGYVDPSAAVAALLRALGVAGERIPPSQGEREALYRSVLALMAVRGERVLVLADNASTVEQVLTLRPGGAIHQMLVTSRHTLPVPGARRVEVDVLSSSESIAVVAHALRAAHPGDERIAAEPRAAAELVRLCGYLPLALRIVAELLADNPGQPIAELVKILTVSTDRLDELAYGDSLVVRVAFDASYRNLPSDQARAFQLMALHPGPHLSLPSVAALTGVAEVVARRLIDGLRRANLIHPATVPGNYRFHDLLRLYAVQRSAEQAPAEREAAIGRLLDYYREITRAADTYLDPRIPIGGRSSLFSGRLEVVTWLEKERANLAAIVALASDSGQDAYVCDISLSLVSFFNLRHHLDDWIANSMAVLAAAERQGDRRNKARALSGLGRAYYYLRDWDMALDCFGQALSAYREDLYISGEAMILISFGNICHDLQKFEEAFDYYRQSLAIAREVGERYDEGQALNNIGYTHADLQRFDDAISSYRQSLAVFQELDDEHGQAAVLTNLGMCYLGLHRSDDAINCHQQALAIFQKTGDQLREARTLANLGNTYRDMRRSEEGLACHRQALAIFRDLRDRYGEGTALSNLASTFQQLQRANDALDYYRQALIVFSQANAADDVDRVRTHIADLMAHLQANEG
jgi:tetratricopeptide (TPR) repeat protein